MKMRTIQVTRAVATASAKAAAAATHRQIQLSAPAEEIGNEELEDEGQAPESLPLEDGALALPGDTGDPSDELSPWDVTLPADQPLPVSLLPRSLRPRVLYEIDDEGQLRSRERTRMDRAMAVHRHVLAEAVASAVRRQLDRLRTPDGSFAEGLWVRLEAFSTQADWLRELDTPDVARRLEVAGVSGDWRGAFESALKSASRAILSFAIALPNGDVVSPGALWGLIIKKKRAGAAAAYRAMTSNCMELLPDAVTAVEVEAALREQKRSRESKQRTKLRNDAARRTNAPMSGEEEGEPVPGESRGRS